MNLRRRFALRRSRFTLRRRCGGARFALHWRRKKLLTPTSNYDQRQLQVSNAVSKYHYLTLTSIIGVKCHYQMPSSNNAIYRKLSVSNASIKYLLQISLTSIIDAIGRRQISVSNARVKRGSLTKLN